jgi:hypothetical protein
MHMLLSACDILKTQWFLNKFSKLTKFFQCRALNIQISLEFYAYFNGFREKKTFEY